MRLARPKVRHRPAPRRHTRLAPWRRLRQNVRSFFPIGTDRSRIARSRRNRTAIASRSGRRNPLNLRRFAVRHFKSVGSDSVNVDPAPGRLFTRIRPLCAATIPLTIANPRPSPRSPGRRAWPCFGKGENRVSRTSGEIPDPRSSTVICTWRRWTQARSTTFEPELENWIAFLSSSLMARRIFGRASFIAGIGPSH